MCSAAGCTAKQNPLARDFNFLSLLRFTLPTIVMMIFMGLYTITDTLFVARLVNTDALSALNIACPAVNVIVGIGAMLATGGSALIAKKLGEGDEVQAQRDFTLMIAIGFILGVAIAVIGIVFIDEIVLLLGASDLLSTYCSDYLFTLLLFTPASLLQILFQTLFVTAGRPLLGMLLCVGAGVLNVALDYIFMAMFQMGIAGSALGTGIGYLVPAIAGIVFFSTCNGTLRFRKPLWSPETVRNSCFNGSSEMVSQCATAVTTYLFNVAMLRLLGENGVAAITILIYTQFFLTSLYIGFSIGVAPVISYHYGAGNASRLQHIFRICLIFITLTSLFVFALSMQFGSSLASVFSPIGTDVYEITSGGFAIYPFSFLFCGFNIFFSAAFTALSNGKASALISFLRTFGLIATCLIVLPRLFGVPGIWLSVPIAEGISLIVSIYLLFLYRKKYFRPGNAIK